MALLTDVRRTLTVSNSLNSFDSGQRRSPCDGSPDKLPVRAYGESAWEMRGSFEALFQYIEYELLP